MQRTYLKAGRAAVVILCSLGMALPMAMAQAAYTPKFKGDPARSDSEAAALGYIRTVVRAENAYNRKNGHFTHSLLELVHTGSFTKRMTQTAQGDYTVKFLARKDGYEIWLTPKQIDAQHRAFYTNSNEDGIIHGDQQQEANVASEKV